jgi:predicted HicB family RNase H-like nuclease
MPNSKPKTLRDQGLVMVGARLPVELHKRANHYCVDNDMSLRDLLEAAITEYLKKTRRANSRTD